MAEDTKPNQAPPPDTSKNAAEIQANKERQAQQAAEEQRRPSVVGAQAGVQKSPERSPLQDQALSGTGAKPQLGNQRTSPNQAGALGERRRTVQELRAERRPVQKVPGADPEDPAVQGAVDLSLNAESRPRGPSAPRLATGAQLSPGPQDSGWVDPADGPLMGPEVNPPTNPNAPTVFPGPEQNLQGLPALPVDERHPASATQAGTRPTAQAGGGQYIPPERLSLEERKRRQRLEAIAKGAQVPLD